MTKHGFGTGYLVRGFQIRQGMGMALLTFALDATDDKGNSAMEQGASYVLSPEYCRELAQLLVQAAEGVEATTGRS